MSISQGSWAQQRARAIAAVTMTLWGLVLLGPPLSGQSEAAVREAVRDCSGLAPENYAAREQLKAWGDSALPILGRLLDDPGSLRPSRIASAIVLDPTQAGMDLLVSRLQRGGPRFWFQLSMATDFHRHQLGPNTRLRELVLERLGDEQELRITLGHCVRIAGNMGWREALPALRELQDHEDYSLRMKVGKALTQLTGQPVTIRKPIRSFPDLALGAVVFERVGALPAPERGLSQPRHEVSQAFCSWPFANGERHVLLHHGSPDSLSLLDEMLEVVQEVPLAGSCQDVYLLPREDAGTPQLVSVRRRVASEEVAAVVALDLEGRELWRHELGYRYVHSSAVLHDQGAIRGLVVGMWGAAGFLALDLSGEVLWQLTERRVMYDVSTHRGLASHASLAGGDIVVVNAAGQPVGDDGGSLGMREPPPRTESPRLEVSVRPIYVSRTCVFPDDSGRPATVLAGRGAHSVPTLARLDASGRPVWTATLPDHIRQLGLLEPDDGPRLVVCTTTEGFVYIVTEEGTLVWEEQVIEREPALIVGLKAGRLGDAWAFALRTFHETIVYRLRSAGDR